MCKFLNEHICPILWGIYLGAELLGHIITLFLTFWRNKTVFESGCIVLTISPLGKYVPIIPQTHQSLLWTIFFYCFYPMWWKVVYPFGMKCISLIPRCYPPLQVLICHLYIFVPYFYFYLFLWTLIVLFFVEPYFIFKYILLQNCFHTTPSAHPNKWPPQCPSPTFPSPPLRIKPQFVLCI